MWQLSRLNKALGALVVGLALLGSANSQTIRNVVASASPPPPYQGPGDVVASPLGWWGLRAFTKAYGNGNGNAAIICDQATGLTCSTINVLPSGNFDVTTAKASAACASVCIVKQLFDQTGGGRHLVAASPITTNAPVLTFNCIGALVCMTFNGSNSLKATSGYTQAQYSAEAVANTAVAPPPNMVFISHDNATGNSASAFYLYTQSSGGTVGAVFATNAVNSVTIPTGVLHSYHGTIDAIGAVEQVFVDAIGATRSISVNSIVAADFPQMGGSFNGTLQEAGFWPVVFTQTQVSTLDNNERNYWKASPVSGTFYISAATGNDQNDGRSPLTPWATVAQVAKQNFAANVTLNFHGGDNFSGCLHFINGTNAVSNITVQSYGTGASTITANCSGSKIAAISFDNVSHVNWNGVNLVGNTGGAQYGVQILNQLGTSPATDITVQNSDISGFYTTTTSDYGGEVFVQGFPGNGGLDHINILSNKLHGSAVSSPDDNGITGFGNGENITNIHYASNQVYNIGAKGSGINGAEGNGILVNGITGLNQNSNIVEKNLIHDLGANTTTCGGPAGAWSNSSNNVIFQYNEVYNMQPTTFASGCDWDAYDADANSTNIIFQYNYSHNNRGPGNLNFCSGTWGPVTWRYNISENDNFGTTDDTSGNFFWQNQGCSGVTLNVYNNTYYNSLRGTGPRPVAFAFQAGVPSAGIVENNIFAVTTDAFSNNFFSNMEGNSPTGMTFANNSYWAISGSGNFLNKHPSCTGGNCTSLAQWQAVIAGGDTNATVANPTWVTPVGTNVTCGVTTGAQTCPAGYKLNTGSTYKNTGIAITSPGSTDFFLSTIPTGTGTGYPIGASN